MMAKKSFKQTRADADAISSDLNTKVRAGESVDPKRHAEAAKLNREAAAMCREKGKGPADFYEHIGAIHHGLSKGEDIETARNKAGDRSEAALKGWVTRRAGG